MPPKQSPNKLQKAPKNLQPYADLAASVSKMSITSQKRAPKTHFRVILAVPEWYKNEFMIGDFVGIKYYLNLMGLWDRETFWSTINIHQYLNESGHRDIKIRSETAEKVVYSNFEVCHRQNDYLMIDPQSILTQFRDWMIEKAKETELGDVVNIIMICHGSTAPGSEGTLEIGNARIEPALFSNMVKGFKQDVQVNIVTNACGSGGLCLAFSPQDQKNRLIIAAAGPNEGSSGNELVGWTKGMSKSGRFRNSFFTDVIIKSLGKINMDGLGPSIYTLGENLRVGVWDKPQPEEAKSLLQMTGSSAQEADMKLQQILHFDYVDFPRNPRRASRFLRQELQYQVVLQASDDIDDWGFGQCRQDIETLFQWEISKSDTAHASSPGDAELYMVMARAMDSKLKGRRFKISQILKALEIRAKIQSSFFSVFMFLNDLCLVSFEGLRTPMQLAYASQDDDIRLVMGVLLCFEGIQKFTRHWKVTFSGLEMFLVGPDGYTTPLLWLATLIVRGAIVEDLYALMARIEVLGEFGKFNGDKAMQIWPRTRKLVQNIYAGLCLPKSGKNDLPVVAFWLPHNFGQVIKVEALYENFDERVYIRLEDIFFRFFGLENDPTLPNEWLSAKFLKQELTDGTREF
ncbi:hypothetical protein L207DRAFT_637535 [Hyaloscypha variabilis F]|uniref:Uncharacterized protein n=1 Tax=Hyaloscypha variabilis (strain UAMH 11265 / GT02V1 / F) TaxID=1149755 RepID=A0A2J6R9E9_HYAVF|nr:hypothetical protein L207DRAFT_637535 [Hyaloscypha variabilis F]